MSDYVFTLTTAETLTLTHWKICRINIEVERQDKPGYIEIYLAKCRKVGQDWVEDVIPGQKIKIEDTAFEMFKQTKLEGVTDLASMEYFLYSVLSDMGYLPAGSINAY